MGSKTCGDPGVDQKRVSGGDVAEGLCQEWKSLVEDVMRRMRRIDF